MSGIAMAIVLASAFLHAGWNFLLKKSERKIVFIWWFLLLSGVFYLPMFLYYIPQVAIPVQGWYCIVATGLIHGVYFWCMGGAYQRGDLSLVYPLARGSGPLFIPIFAMILLHEEVSLLGMAGIVLIVVGIYCAHLCSFTGAAFLEPFRALRRGASLWALFTGFAIASYSLVDKVGVGLVYPPVYIYLMFLISFATITPWVLIRERHLLIPEWRTRRGSIAVVGFLSGFTYLMVLFALTMSKVSYVAAVREVSIVLSAFFGVVWLKEKNGLQKLVGAVFITLGVIAIGLSR
ncbi:MAG: EamA family transporter [Syntrophales bacterium]